MERLVWISFCVSYGSCPTVSPSTYFISEITHHFCILSVVLKLYNENTFWSFRVLVRGMTSITTVDVQLQWIGIKTVDAFDVHGSVHHSTNHIEITNKMQPRTRIYYCSVLLIAQHVSNDTLLLIRSSKTVIAASGFTYVCGCPPLTAAGNHRLCKTRGCSYSFWAPGDERCVVRNMLSN